MQDGYSTLKNKNRTSLNKGKLTAAEVERNSLYVKYKKSKLIYDKALNAGEDVRELKISVDSNLNRFLTADAALPSAKRLWKSGYTTPE